MSAPISALPLAKSSVNIFLWKCWNNSFDISQQTNRTQCSAACVSLSSSFYLLSGLRSEGGHSLHDTAVSPPPLIGRDLSPSQSPHHFPELWHYVLHCPLTICRSRRDWVETINFILKIKNHQFFHQIPNMDRNFWSVSVRLLKYELHKSQSRLGWSGIMASNCSPDYHQISTARKICFNNFTDKFLQTEHREGANCWRLNTWAW